MNTVNSSTGFSGFQLHIEHSPQIVPPLFTTDIPDNHQDMAKLVTNLLDQLANDVVEAQENLLQAQDNLL